MDKIILDTDPEAATQKTLTLWVSRNGLAYTDERAARYAGCTHKKCECGHIMEKHWLGCEACRDKRDHERCLAMPTKEWDGKTPLCIYGSDKYFYDDDDLFLYCEDHGIKETDLHLVICKPCYFTEIDPNEYYDGLLPEDGVVPETIAMAFEALNEKINAFKEPVCWIQGDFRAILEG